MITKASEEPLQASELSRLMLPGRWRADSQLLAKGFVLGGGQPTACRHLDVQSESKDSLSEFERRTHKASAACTRGVPSSPQDSG